VALVLAVTGLLLNHSDDLHLAQRKVHAAWLLALYGIEAPHPGAAFPAGASWVSQWGGQLFLDATPLPGTSDAPGAPASPLLGAFRLDESQAGGAALAVATARQLLLLTGSGQLVDALAYPDRAEAVRAAAAGDGRIVIEAAGGGRWSTSPDFLDIVAVPSDAAGAPAWSRSQVLPDGLRSRIEQFWRGDGVSVERLVLDLHNGRLVGRAGPWLMDAAGVALIVLVVTGLLSVWLRSRRR
jgi:hypothetical protein